MALSIKAEMRIPSKLLLFGEYLVIAGGDSLALPYYPLYGEFGFDFPATDRDAQYEAALGMLLDHISSDEELKQHYELDRFRSDIREGIYFKANIPVGYGLGSSGSLVAGLYKRYGRNQSMPVDQLKEVLARTENCFHGNSSGMDPLVCYLESAVLQSAGKLSVVEPPLPGEGWFLLDSGMPRSTQQYVSIFQEKMNDSSYRNAIESEFLPIGQEMLKGYLNETEIGGKLNVYSEQQLQLFAEMIPSPISDIWKSGLQSGAYSMKLCGAGGGGFFLLKASDPEQLAASTASYYLRPLSSGDFRP